MATNDLKTLVKSNSNSSNTSSGDLKQDVEPVEVALPLNNDSDGNPSHKSAETKVPERTPLLDDMNANPHHNTPDECLECSCDETVLKENMEKSKKESQIKSKLCKNCSLNKKGESDNSSEHEKIATEVTSSQTYTEPRIEVTESKEEPGTEPSPTKQRPAENTSVLNLTVGKRMTYCTRGMSNLLCTVYTNRCKFGNWLKNI